MSGLVYDKKQLPQIIGLAVLSVGLFGYFAFKMFTPPPSQAAAPVATQSTSAATGPGTGASGPDSETSLTNPDVTTLIGASAPNNGMRDPFATPATFAAPPPAPAAAKPQPAGIPGIPGLADVQPLPAGPAPEATNVWSVTGVIRSDDNPDAAIAIFRSGDERRYVHLGGMVDDKTRLVGIDRGGVTISRDNVHTRLPLGPSVSSPAGAPGPAAPSRPDSSPVVAVPALPDLTQKPQATPAEQETSTEQDTLAAQQTSAAQDAPATQPTAAAQTASIPSPGLPTN